MLGDKVDTTTFNETVDGVETTLDGIAEDMGNLLEEKADKATSLLGYGITDAYTKTKLMKQLEISKPLFLEIEVIADSLIGGDTV